MQNIFCLINEYSGFIKYFLNKLDYTILIDSIIFSKPCRRKYGITAISLFTAK